MSEYHDPNEYGGYSGYPPPPEWGVAAAASAPPPSGPAPHTAADLATAAILAAVLGALGALLGFVWSAWSGPQQRAFVIGPGKLYPYDEVETMAASDGRYLVIVAAVGLVAALLVWFLRPANRGPLGLLALVIGGLLGAALTEWIGHLSGGGTFNGATGSTIAHLPLSLHMRGLLFVEPAVASLVYGLLVSFASRDDLGRADPVRERVSVRAGDHSQDAWRDGDAAGALQQRDLPPQ